MRTRYNRRTVEVISLTDQAIDILPLADAKAFLRVDGSDDDVLLTMLIGAAVTSAEKYLARALRRQTLELTLDGFPFADDDALVRLGQGVHQVALSWVVGDVEGIDLPYPPIASITSITTYNTANTGAVFSSAAYFLDGFRVTLNRGYTWPTDLRDRAAVKVRYVAGYGPINLPMDIKLGMMQHLVAMYECRTGCEMPEAARGMMNAYRITDGLTW